MADEERRLVDAAQRGDGESFNALVRLYESRVYNLIYRMPVSYTHLTLPTSDLV